jgi:hypothetical protein
MSSRLAFDNHGRLIAIEADGTRWLVLGKLVVSTVGGSEMLFGWLGKSARAANSAGDGDAPRPYDSSYSRSTSLTLRSLRSQSRGGRPRIPSPATPSAASCCNSPRTATPLVESPGHGRGSGCAHEGVPGCAVYQRSDRSRPARRIAGTQPGTDEHLESLE